MTVLTEGRLSFEFPADCIASKYDDWAFYRNRFQRVAGSKAVDFLCIDANVAWLIEVKDYRHGPRTKPSELHDEMAAKVRDTLAGLAAAQADDASPDSETARKALAKRRWRVVLHLQQSQHKSRLRPKAIDPASLRMKLCRAVRAVDPHPMVVDDDGSRVPWVVVPNRRQA